MKIQTVLTTKAGHDVPMELVAAILKRNPTAFGFVVQDDSGKTPELSIGREATTPTEEQIEEFMKNSHDFASMLYFGELGSKFNTDDIQPLIIRDAKDAPFITLGVEGDFSKHIDLKSGRSDEYNFANSILIPELLKICEETDGDFDKIYAAISDDKFNNLLLSHIGHRGSLTVFGLEGDPIWLGKNELGNSYDWGQTSNLHGYGETKQEPAPEKRSRFSFGGSTKQESPPALPADTATKGAVGPRSSVPEVRADGKNLPQPVKCPDWVHKNDDKRTWYAMVSGSIPDRFKNRVPVLPIIPEDQLPKDLADLKTWEAEQLKVKLRSGSAVTAVAAEPVHQPGKTETSSGVPKSGAEIAAQRAEENRPLISAPDMEKILNIVTGVKPTDMMSITEIQNVEKKLGDFSSAVGCTPFEMINWPMSLLFAIGKQDYRAIVLAMVEFRKLWRDTLKAEDLVGTSTIKGNVKTTETKLGDNTKKVESVVTGHVLAKQELAPEKKKGFSFGKKVA